MFLHPFARFAFEYPDVITFAPGGLPLIGKKPPVFCEASYIARTRITFSVAESPAV
jgi:hypothetical protein